MTQADYMGAGKIVAKYVMSPAAGAVDTASRKVPGLAGLVCGFVGHDPQVRVGMVNVVEMSVVEGLAPEARRASIDQCTRCRKRRVNTPFLGKVWTD